MRLIIIDEASIEDDKHHATDFVAHIKGGDVAVRIRRPDCLFRDWTIRSKIIYGKTELAKLQDGFGDWYLYCWTNQKGNINEWMFIDLNLVRISGLLDKMALQFDIPNNDGTYFKSCSIAELIKNECLMSYQRY